MREDLRAEHTAFVSLERAAKREHARALQAARAAHVRRDGTPPMVAVGFGRRAWDDWRRRLHALRRLRGRPAQPSTR